MCLPLTVFRVYIYCLFKNKVSSVVDHNSDWVLVIIMINRKEQRDRDRQTHRQKQRERQTDRQTGIDTHRETDRQTDLRLPT